MRAKFIKFICLKNIKSVAYTYFSQFDNLARTIFSKTKAKSFSFNKLVMNDLGFNIFFANHTILSKRSTSSTELKY